MVFESLALVPTHMGGIHLERGHGRKSVCSGKDYKFSRGVWHFAWFCKTQDNVLQLNTHRRKTMRLLSYGSLVKIVFPRSYHLDNCKAK